MGVKSASVTGAGVFKDAASDAVVRQAFFDGAIPRFQIVVPDFDELYARDAKRLEELFAAGPDEKVEASEDYLTWVEFSCPA